MHHIPNEANISREHVTQEIDRAISTLSATMPGSTYPSDHAVIHNELERGGFTPMQQLVATQGRALGTADAQG